ncbi:hypothetical protein [Desulfocurvus sp.]|uniref:hypothetical protein n=1 Tax=Desulfocurvus sp. TaxID=2871698 RepID=UPI0025BB1209|nr:hypothetical protein [Desulfocurvus sp.]MCK9239793.1 hypothetical protein [Desulfocurvus sp.]
MRVIPFEVAHVRRLELRPADRLGFAARGGRRGLLALAAMYRASGPCWTLLHAGAVVACGGVGIQPGATGNAWALTSALVEAHPVACARLARRCLEAAESGLGLTRIQTTVHVRHSARAKWFGFLGFEREALLRRLVGDDNYYLYARVR